MASASGSHFGPRVYDGPLNPLARRLVIGAGIGGLTARKFGLASPFWLGAALLVIALVLPLTARATESTA